MNRKIPRKWPRLSLCLAGLLVALPELRAAESNSRPAPAWLLAETEVGEGVPFPELIHLMAGHRVLPWAGEDAAALHEAARLALDGLRERPALASRANEAGLVMEERLSEALAQVGFAVGTPRTQSGQRRSAGYPDLVARRDGRTYYIEVKAFSPGARDSTQRTFYLSPSPDPKIREDAVHLLFGFELETPEPGVYQATRVEALDLYGLRCALKVEFNASNRDLYGRELTVFEVSPGKADTPADAP